IVEVEELDLYFHGLQLQYNIPSTMCTYLIRVPYYYYGLEPGVGPTTVQVDTDSAGAVGIDTNNDGTVDSAADTICDYDYSAAGGPNCCTGTYFKVARTWDADAGVYTASSSQNEWGGAWSNCLDGPAMDTQSLNTGGYPTFPIAYVAGTGINDVYEIP